MNDTFGPVVIAVFFIAELESVSSAGDFQWRHAIDEKHGVADVVYLAEFDGERMSEDVYFRRFELRME